MSFSRVRTFARLHTLHLRILRILRTLGKAICLACRAKTSCYATSPLKTSSRYLLHTIWAVVGLAGCSGAPDSLSMSGGGPEGIAPEAGAPAEGEAGVGTTDTDAGADPAQQVAPPGADAQAQPPQATEDAQPPEPDAGAVLGANDAAPVDGPRRAADGGRGGIDAAPDKQPPQPGDAGADECVGGWTGQSSSDTRSPTPVRGYGGVQVQMPTTAQIVALHTVLAVPAKPPPAGTLFLWPGLQPLPKSANFNPIGNGVLQPVLTWGGTCAPTAPSNVFASWWVSAQYVNTYAKYMGHTGCNGGQGMNVAVGDSLDITMSLSGTIWKQVVVDMQTGTQATYDIDMLGQAQDWAIFSIEGYNQKAVADVVFTSTTLTMSAPQTSACQPNVRGTNDYFSTPSTSSDGLKCCIPKIILRSQGVAATSPNAP